MKKKIIQIVVLVFLGFCMHNSFADEGISPVLVKQLRGTGSGQINDIARDGFGNIYTVGVFINSVDFDPGIGVTSLTSVGPSDAFFAKYNSNGDLLWVRQLGGAGFIYDVGRKIEIDNSGNCYLAGEFTGTVDFDPSSSVLNLTASGYRNVFFAKYDSNGNLIWAKNVEGDQLAEIYIDVNNNFYITGYFQLANADFDPSPAVKLLSLTSNTRTDAYFAKYDSDGNLVWANKVGGGDYDYGLGICVNNAEEVFLTGRFGDIADFDPSLSTFNLTSNGAIDIFFAKYDSNGNLIWVKSVGGIGYDGVSGLLFDSFGNIILAASLSGVIDIDPSASSVEVTSSNANGDNFILKYDYDGNYITHNQILPIGASSNSLINAITIDAADNLFLIGYFKGTINSGSSSNNLTSNSSLFDVFILKYSSNGNVEFANKVGGYGDDYGLGIVTDDQNNLYISGVFSGTSDFNPNTEVLNLTSDGAQDPFFAKYCIAPKRTITGATTNCSNTTNTFYVSNLLGSTYNWTVPSGYTIVSGQGTNIVAITVGASIGTISVIETNSNGCGISGVPFTVTPSNGPSTPTISGSTNVCPNQTGVAYSIPASSGATYAWNIPGGGTATPISSNATTVNFGANVSTVEVMVTNTCGNAFASLQLSSNSPYAIGSVDYSCTGTTPICVPFKSVSTLSNGIIGLDFVLNYDATKLTPTGTATLGTVATTYATYSLNIGTPGKVYGTIYLNGAPTNTYISGLGDIICVNFNLASGATPFNTTITSENVEESMPLSSKTVCAATPGTFTYSRPLNAQLYYRNSTATTKRITGVVGNTTTSFTGTDAACNSTGTTVSGVSATGLFSYDISNSSSLKIERDILGDLSVPALNCANIQSVISSTDRNMAAQISNMTIASPTVYELISADVNLDGKVTAGDAALISQRTINANNCEFPQVSNYVFDGTNLVPSPTYTKSKDWIFIDQATLNNPLFTAGMSKNKVPVAPECLSASLISTACTTAADVVYQGILLGDVNGSWVSSNSANAKIASTNELIIDLSKALSLGDDLFSIPVSYISDEVFYGIDMEVDYAESLISLESVSKNSLFGAVGFDWNDVANAKLLVTTFAEAGLVTNQPLLYLQVKSANGKLSSTDLGSITAYFNEKPASTKILAPIINGIENSVFENVSVYPNPASTVLMINGLETTYQTKIYNLLGVEVATLNGSPKEINVSTLSAGVYYLKVISESKEKLIRFTKVN